MESETSDNLQKPWLFQKGKSGNPAGRPKGSKSMKTWAKEYLESLNDEERLEFMDGLPKEVIWKMSEGNPAQTSEHEIKGNIVVELIQYGSEDSNSPQLPTE